MNMNNDYKIKKQKLNEIIRDLTYPVVAYSGGVDSALLAKLCYQFHRDTVQIYSVMTPYTDQWDVAFASAQAVVEKWNLTWIRLNPLLNPDIYCNRKERCYHCKWAILSSIKGRGEGYGGKFFLEGTNYDDTKTNRPGLIAVKDLEYISPLLQAEFTKEDIRTYSYELGLKSWNRHAQSCMLTRFPYDIEEGISFEAIEKIKEGEHILKPFCSDSFRLRWIDSDSVEAEISAFDNIVLRTGGNSYMKYFPFKNLTFKEKQ